MTAGPSGGPASAYPTLSGPASTCFSAPNEVLVPGFIVAASVALILVPSSPSSTGVNQRRPGPPSGCGRSPPGGWEIMITCEPSTSTMSAPARRAIERTTSAPAALSPVATTAQDGSFRQAGGPEE